VPPGRSSAEEWTQYRGTEPVALLVAPWLDDGLGVSLIAYVKFHPEMQHVVTGGLAGPEPDKFAAAGADVIQWRMAFALKLEPELRATLEGRGRSPSRSSHALR